MASFHPPDDEDALLCEASRLATRSRNRRALIRALLQQQQSGANLNCPPKWAAELARLRENDEDDDGPCPRGHARIEVFLDPALVRDLIHIHHCMKESNEDEEHFVFRIGLEDLISEHEAYQHRNRRRRRRRV